MRESERDDDLAAWEARLSAFQPAPSRLNRDRAMYLAGRASVGTELAGRAEPNTAWAWPTAFSVMTAVAGCLLVALILRPLEIAPSTVADRVEEAMDESKQILVQESPAAEESGDHERVPLVEPQRVLWPARERFESLAATSPHLDLTIDADQMIAQLESRRMLRPTSEPEYLAGPRLRSAVPVQPSRPRSYVEYRRMIFEEMTPARDRAPKTTDNHASNGV